MRGAHMPFTVPAQELATLEGRVENALATADDRELDVLGYGEVTLVLRLETAQGAFACKRLPVFPDRQRLEAYRRCLDEYLERLAERRLRVADTELWHMTLPTGRVVAYCV